LPSLLDCWPLLYDLVAVYYATQRISKKSNNCQVV